MNQFSPSGIKYGALSLLALSLLWMTPPALADKAADPPTISVNEEVVNTKVFEVSRMKVNASAEEVWKILVDYHNAQKVYAKIVRCQLVKEEGESKFVFFSVHAMGNLITLEYTLDVHEKFPNIEWTRASGAFKANEGYWHLEPCDEGKACTVTFAKFIDGGVIPQCLVNKEMKTSMPIIMTHVKELAESRSILARNVREISHS
jgi:ribosome-associated toxin RatA of RatAB toxin-antitoxin module